MMKSNYFFEVRTNICKALEEIGVIVRSDYEDDIDLREYIQDSIQFITAMVQIEKAFNIEIPDELLLYDNIMSLNAFCEVIIGLKNV